MKSEPHPEAFEMAVDAFLLWLDGADNAADASQLVFRDLRGFVQQDDIAELYLLDD